MRGERNGRGAATPEQIPCEEAMARVYEYLDGELDAEWSEAVRRHIEVCKRCWPYFNFERIFLNHIRSRRYDEPRTERLERRIRRLMAEVD